MHAQRASEACCSGGGSEAAQVTAVQLAHLVAGQQALLKHILRAVKEQDQRAVVPDLRKQDMTMKVNVAASQDRAAKHSYNAAWQPHGRHG